MVGQLVHGRHHRVGLHTAHMVSHGVKKSLTISPYAPVITVAVFLHASQKPRDRFHERVVIHDRIPLISLQPGSRIPVVLRQNQRFRISLFYGLAEPAPEFVIVFCRVSQVGSHIQTPAINGIGRGYPLPGHVQYILHQFFRILVI